MGRPGEIWHQDVVDAMQSIIEKCEQRSIGVGTFTDSEEGVEFWSKRGLQFIQYSSDLDLFINAAKKLRFAELMKELF